MRGPLGYYIELVDGAAFDKAESGGFISQSDPPFAPLVFPWVIAGPAVAFLPLNGDWALAIIAVASVASVACWTAFAMFYLRRVRHYRRQFSAGE